MAEHSTAQKLPLAARNLGIRSLVLHFLGMARHRLEDGFSTRRILAVDLAEHKIRLLSSHPSRRPQQDAAGLQALKATAKFPLPQKCTKPNTRRCDCRLLLTWMNTRQFS